MRVYYLTAAEFALNDLRRRRIKISLLNDLNDPFELLAADLPKKEHRDAFNKLKNQLSKNRGVICFTKQWTNPVIWSHYADKHKGICLGFDVPRNILVEIKYTGKRLVIDIENLLIRNAFNENIMLELLSTKFEDWKYENEVRIFASLDERCKETGFYFKDFDEELYLREIIIGPRCSVRLDKIKSSINKYHQQVEIIRARLAFRSFKVVKNLSL